MGTSIDLRDNIYYFTDNAFILGIILIAVSFSVATAIYLLCKDHKHLQFENEGKNETFQKMWTKCSQVSIIYIIIILLYTFTSLYSMNEEITIHGELSTAKLNIDCTDQSYECCSIYNDCSQGLANTINYNSYVFNGEKGKNCPTLAGLVQDYISMHGTTDLESCIHSSYGCCALSTSCDTYVRLNFPYSLYDQIQNNSYGKENLYTYVEKVDARGSNCETSESLVRKYIKVNQNNSISLVICLLVLFTICPCCILAMFKKDDIIKHIPFRSLRNEEEEEEEEVISIDEGEVLSFDQDSELP